jgi:signal transduction histidine kinase
LSSLREVTQAILKRPLHVLSLPLRWRPRPLKDLPIRWRLTLLNALIIGVILVTLAGSFVWLWYEHRVDQVENATRSQAIEAANALEGDPPCKHKCNGEDLLGNDRDELIQATADGAFIIVIRDAQGKVLGQRPLPSNRPDFSTEEVHDTVWKEALQEGQLEHGRVEHSARGANYIGSAVPVKPPDNLANTPTSSARVLEALRPRPSVVRPLKEFGLVLTTVGILAFALSMGGAYLLTRAALSPVEAVVRAAGQITEGDLSRRLPVANPKDEIGRLTTTINALLARLEAAFARLQEALSRLEEALSRQRRFAADASHELRTPLTSIVGYAGMLDRWGMRDPQTAQEGVATIRQESERMQRLVEALLALTRGDEGAPLNIEHNDLAAVAEDVARTAQAAAGEKLAVRYLPAERPLNAPFDRDRILQAASILVDNAVRYTPEGGKVTVAAREKNGWVKLEVSDTGVGIPEDKLPLIFERFYRADPSRGTGGAGLGLSIARQVIEAHGGKIEVESTPGEGSTFRLLLPKEPSIA